ncbi:MAG: hypothetical protein Q8M22_17280 [Actinomycetota bacterium]|nr:hypothetical protein [Actinomycetota bacterium]
MNLTATPTAPETASDRASAGSHAWLQALAHRIADSGIAAHETDIVRAERSLRCDGHCTLLLDILADTSQPAVARERAFGELLVEAATPSSRVMVAA